MKDYIKKFFSIGINRRRFIISCGFIVSLIIYPKAIFGIIFLMCIIYVVNEVLSE